MAIKTYGDAIRRARRMAGQTQAQLCEGICDVMTLSRIETNKNRVSPELFQILMQRTGQDCRMTLEFESREVFEMHQALENAQFRIRMGKLSDAYAYLCQVAASSEYLNHVCRCQKFELAQIQLQLACGASNSLRLCRAAEQSLRRTCPEYEEGCFPNRLLSAQEIELLLAISELYTHTARIPIGIQYCRKLTDYLLAERISYRDQTYLLARIALIESWALLLLHRDIQTSYQRLQTLYKQCLLECVDDILPQLLFQLGVCQAELGDTEHAFMRFKAAVYSMMAMEQETAGLYEKRLRESYGIQLPMTESEKNRCRGVNEYKWLFIPEPTIIRADKTAPCPYRIGDVIRDRRTSLSITLTKLCSGLCSKATLSKIENGTQMPGKYLADALLQRLGLEGDAFYPFCGEKEFEFLEKERKLVDYCSLKGGNNYSLARALLKELDTVATTAKKPLIRQICISDQLLVMEHREERIEEYLSLAREGLRCTIPDFDERKLQHYSLSYIELSLLNQLAIGYRMAGNRIQAIQLLYRLLEYYDQKEYSLRVKERTFPVTLQLLFHYLYLEKRFAEILSLEPYMHDTAVIHIDEMLVNVYLYYSQAIAEKGRKNEAIEYGKYTCALLCLQQEAEEAKIVEEEFINSFRLDIRILL